VPREVRDRDYFYLWSYSAWSVWAALGLVALWRTLAMRVNAAGSSRWISTAPILLLAAIPLVGNWRDASRAGETTTREWAHDLLNSVEPYGILITLGDNDTFPLWYAQEVEGVRQDVTVAVTSLLNTDWYPRALLRRPIVAYDAAKGPAVYRGRSWPMPTTPIFSSTIAQLDSVPEYVDLRTPQLFQHGSLRAVVDPRQLEYGVPVRSDLLVLQLLKDNYGVRPFYIARTTGGYVQALGLEPYALMQGLTNRILTVPAPTNADTVAVPGLGHVDVPRSLTLWRSYGGPQSILARGDWVDRPSVNIPATYIGTALILGQILGRQGDTVQANKLNQTAVELAHATRTLDLFMGPEPSPPPAVQGGDAPRSAPIPATP